MLVHYDPDEFETVVSQRTCPYHEAHPGVPYAGCTCSSSYGQRRRSAEEIHKIKEHKRKEREDAILVEADIIRARRR